MKKVLLILAIAALPLFALAQAPEGGSPGSAPPASASPAVFPASGSPAVFPEGGSPSAPVCNGGSCSVKNPLNVTSFCGIIKKGFYALMPIVVAVGVVFIIWSGFLFVFAQGNQKKLQTARRTFYYVVIGLAVVLGAWIIAEVIAATINTIANTPLIVCT